MEILEKTLKELFHSYVLAFSLYFLEIKKYFAIIQSLKNSNFQSYIWEIL